MNKGSNLITIKRLLISIDFIEDGLYDNLSVDVVAQSANYSTYHFCRMFKAVVGDSVMMYIKKRRLTEAANLLATTEESILDIAIKCQFESQEAFTRSFKNQFNETPGKYRKINERFRLLHKKKFDLDLFKHRSDILSIEPDIIVKPAISVVGISTVYQYDDFNLMEMWGVFRERQAEIKNRVTGVAGFGIYENYQENIDAKQETVFTYLCCAEVTTLSEIPDNMVGRNIPEQMYAVFTHKGKINNIDSTLCYIWGDWLPASQYQYANKPDFELYSNKFNPASENSELYLYIPIKKST